MVNPTPKAINEYLNSMPVVYGNTNDLEVWIYSDLDGANKIAEFTLQGDTTNGKLVLKDIIQAPVQQVATPIANPAGGQVVAGTQVTLCTTTAEATIYYTTDGNDPTMTGTIYNTPIPVNADVTINAIAVKAGMTNSAILTAAYTMQTAALESIAITAPAIKTTYSVGDTLDNSASNQEWRMSLNDKVSL